MTIKNYSKQTILTGIACILLLAMSLIISKKAYAMNGMGCYISQVYSCSNGCQTMACNFTGVYGTPFNCSEWTCEQVTLERHCVYTGN